MMRLRRFGGPARRLAAVWAVAAALSAAALPASACRLALVLATDVSGSIDPAEYRFQMDGLADALGDPVIADQLVVSQAALMMIQWSGTGEQHVSIPWQRMLSHRAVARFADQVRATPRKWSMSKTAIGEAIRSSVSAFSEVPDCTRRVIDISGDGMTNDGTPNLTERQAAAAAGVTVNGLAIDRVGRSVTEYFRRHVIVGPNSFVETATGYSDYPRAIERKLFRELVKPAS